MMRGSKSMMARRMVASSRGMSSVEAVVPDRQGRPKHSTELRVSGSASQSWKRPSRSSSSALSRCAPCSFSSQYGASGRTALNSQRRSAQYRLAQRLGVEHALLARLHLRAGVGVGQAIEKGRLEPVTRSGLRHGPGAQVSAAGALAASASSAASWASKRSSRISSSAVSASGVHQDALAHAAVAVTAARQPFGATGHQQCAVGVGRQVRGSGWAAGPPLRHRW